MHKILVLTAISLLFTGCTSGEYEGLTAEEWFNEYDAAVAENQDLTYQIEDLQNEYDNLQYEHDDLVSEFDDLIYGYEDLEAEYADLVNCLNRAYDYEEFQDCA